MNLKLHGHPQRQAYTDPSQFIRPSFQGHFGRGDVGNDPTKSTHVHVEPLFPLYAELGAQEVDVPFTLQAHHLSGRIGGFFGENIQRVLWDKTGTATPPPMIGDPEGDLSWTGVATIDVSKAGDQRFAAKAPGWGITRFGARVYFGDVPDDGNRADVCGWCGFYSVVNPQLPEVPAQPAGSRGILSCRVDAFTLANKNNSGTMVMEVQDFLPVLPIDKPWTAPVQGYNYTGTGVTVGAFEMRRDIDFHHGGAGITEAIALADRTGVIRNVTFDPLTMGNGAHKEAMIWRQTLGDESIWSLITFPVTVGDVAMPPPQLCNDPLALNVGQPLPCVYAGPADPFAPFGVSFKRIPGTNRVQLCDISTGVAVGEIVFK